MIEDILPGNKTRLKIIKAIYENPGINLTGLIKKVKASPNFVLKYVNKLSFYNIIKDVKTEKKKIHVRNLKPNFNGLGKVIYSFIETEKKLMFFKKYKHLELHLMQLIEILNNKAEFALIYGSYARFAATPESDLDILIVGKLNREEINRIREVFVSLEVEPSIKIETKSKFIKNKNKPLYQNIIKEHVIICGEIEFIDIVK